MKLPTFKLSQKLTPYRGVIRFVIILAVSNFFWKYNVLGDETDTLVTLFGINISTPFVFMARHVAELCSWLLHTIGSNVTLDASNTLRHGNNVSVQIIWGCTGLKQAYIFFCIIAFSRGPWAKKIWYIPLGLLVVYLFNILRITFIVAFIENHHNTFDLLHFYIFKYLFYLIIFAMWVYWEEIIIRSKQLSIKH